MAAGLIEKSINGKTYEFEKLGGEEAFDMLLDISQVAGKPIGMALGILMGKQVDGSPLEQEVTPDLLGNIFEALTTKMDKKFVKPIVKKLTIEKVLCDGKRVGFDYYSDNWGDFFLVLRAALEVQFGNFFAALLGLIGAKGPVIARAPQT